MARPLGNDTYILLPVSPISIELMIHMINSERHDDDIKPRTPIHIAQQEALYDHAVIHPIEMEKGCRGTQHLRE